MKLKAYNLGACGMCQMFHAGTVNFDTEGIATGVPIVKVPAGLIVTRAVAVVTTAFNAATTNVLTVGKKGNANEIFGDTDITEGTPGTYQKNVFVDMGSETEIYVKYTQTGSAASAGSAEIYLEVVPAPLS